MDEKMQRKKLSNDSTFQKLGDFYHYLVALKDCFEMEKEEKLLFETFGDISVLNIKGGKFQKEVKHHMNKIKFGNRDNDVWKTLANWYENFEKIKDFSELIIYTTATPNNKSIFSKWNNIDTNKKYNELKSIGAIKKKKEKNFREQYDRIFNKNHNKQYFIEILSKVKIDHTNPHINHINNKLLKYTAHIPPNNRDTFINALIGILVFKVKDEPHKWEVTREEFDKLLQKISSHYVSEKEIPLPSINLANKLTNDIENKYSDWKFVEAIRDINYEQEISSAILDYWNTDLLMINFFQNNPLYLESLDEYKNSLKTRLVYGKRNHDLLYTKEHGIIKSSQIFYNNVMSWTADNFGSIIHNKQYFQHGVIHNIVQDTDFEWKMEEEKNEHK